MIFTPHFKLVHFLVSSDYPELVTPINELPWDVAQNVSRLVFHVLQPLRDKYGRIDVTSGFRDLLLNRAVGAEDDSTHRNGRGVDIYFASEPAEDVWRDICRNPMLYQFDRLACYPEERRFHVEVWPANARPRRLLYLATPTWEAVSDG